MLKAMAILVLTMCVFAVVLSAGTAQTQTEATAVAQLRVRAERGDADAQSSLCVKHLTGEGVPEDYAQALSWCRKAAEQGYAPALFALGLVYANGKGVPQDYIEAHKWANLATARADREHQKKHAELRDYLATVMTPEQLAEAQRRAQAWTPRDSSPVAKVASSPVPASEAAVRWRRVTPAPTAILQLKPEDRNPSPNPDMFERAAAAVVGLSGPQGTGTAFLITRDGLALTNHHVVDKQGALKATLRDGRQLAVRVLRSNPEADVALIQINCVTDCFTLDPARSNPSIGREIHVIGNPLAWISTEQDSLNTCALAVAVVAR